MELFINFNGENGSKVSVRADHVMSIEEYNTAGSERRTLITTPFGQDMFVRHEIEFVIQRVQEYEAKKATEHNLMRKELENAHLGIRQLRAELDEAKRIQRFRTAPFGQDARAGTNEAPKRRPDFKDGPDGIVDDGSDVEC